jgi:nucleoside 2-deoxyribosyltransferase
MNVKRVYIATSGMLRDRADSMRDMLLQNGIETTSRWIDHPDIGVRMGGIIEAEADYEDIRKADVVVFINPEDWANSGTGGRHCEVGYAQALGKPIFILGAITNVFHTLPSVSVYEDAISLIEDLQMSEGVALRPQPMGHLLTALANRVHDANAKWWIDIDTHEPLKRNVGELLMLTVSELCEAGEGAPEYGILLMETAKLLARAMEGHRKTMMDDKLPHRKMFDVEIIDAIIRLTDICGGLIPDAGDVFNEKMSFNAVRVDHTHEARKAAGGKAY